MNKLPVFSSPKTSAVGIVQLIVLVMFVVYKHLIAVQSFDDVEIALIFTQFSVMLTSIFARDNDKSSEDVGAKTE